jgi:NAD(P)-dependent dehydrogenase (short-subunit alcohol dehydrogenase family)
MELGPGSVAVVTGAAGGIGLALSESLARAGCSVVLADVEEDALAAASEQVAALGTDTLKVATDVSKADHVEALAQATIDRFGAVHVVCNNAGVTDRGDPWIGPIEAWEWTMGVNFWGVVHGVRAFLPHLMASESGHIVNTASIAGLWPGLSASYDASKHAVVAVTEDLFNTLRSMEMPIGVSCLCPGWVRTGILEAERNWPADLGQAPVADAAQEVSLDYVRRAVAEGAQPSAVADLVVDAIRADRYWVFPQAEFLDLAIERFHGIGEGLDPSPPEDIPGLPPRSQMMAEAMAAMAASLEES